MSIYWLRELYNFMEWLGSSYTCTSCGYWATSLLFHSCPGNNAVAVPQPLLSSFSSQEGVAVVSSDCDGAAHSCCFYPLFRMFNTLHQQQCYVWQAGSYQWPFCVPHSNVQVSQVWDCIHGEPSFNNVHVHNTGSTVRIARWDHLTHPVTAPSQLY